MFKKFPSIIGLVIVGICIIISTFLLTTFIINQLVHYFNPNLPEWSYSQTAMVFILMLFFSFFYSLFFTKPTDDNKLIR